MRTDIIVRMLKRVSVEQLESSSSCWEVRPSSSGGYAFVWCSDTNKSRLAHRVSYERFVGPISDGMQIDHLCRNRSCVNPSHLRQATPQQNVLCGMTLAADNSRKTRCPRGHEYSDQNTMRRNGRRHCRSCDRFRKLTKKTPGPRAEGQRARAE